MNDDLSFSGYTSFLKAERHKMVFGFNYAYKANKFSNVIFAEPIEKTILKQSKNMRKQAVKVKSTFKLKASKYLIYIKWYKPELDKK